MVMGELDRDPVGRDVARGRPMSRHGRGRAGGLTVVMVAVLLSACGGGGGGGVPRTATGAPLTVEAMASATEAAISARASLVWSFEGLGKPESRSELGGAYDFRNDRGVMRGRDALGDGTGQMELRWVGGVTYSLVSGEGSGSDAEWVRYAHDPTARAVGMLFAPTMASLRTSAVGLEEIGAAKVRGTEVGHYRVVLDSEQSAAENEAGAARPRTAMEVWVDRQDRIRRFTFAITGTAPDGEPFSDTMTWEFWDFGVPVEVQAPPAAQTKPCTASWCR